MIVSLISGKSVAAGASLTILRASTFFEDYLITIVKYLSQKKWMKNNFTPHQQYGATKNNQTTGTGNAKNPPRIITEVEDSADTNNCCCNLLYLATALNLPGLIHVIFQWVDTNPHAKLANEVDCEAQDTSSGYTPLVSTEDHLHEI